MSVQKQDAGDARRDDWGTPPWLFAWCDRRWGPFDLDVAADEENTLCRFWITEEEDGLLASWKGHRVWCNPPYSHTAEFCERAALHALDGGRAVLLVPAATDTVWFHDLVVLRADEIVFLCGRVPFIDPTGEARAGNNHASVLVYYSPVLSDRPRPAVWWASLKAIKGIKHTAPALQPGLPFA